MVEHNDMEYLALEKYRAGDMTASQLRDEITAMDEIHELIRKRTIRRRAEKAGFKALKIFVFLLTLTLAGFVVILVLGTYGAQKMGL